MGQYIGVIIGALVLGFIIGGGFVSVIVYVFVKKIFQTLEEERNESNRK